MGDSLITVVTILLAAILMFIFPMMAISERNDDVSELTVQTAVAEFVNNSRNIGKITEANYSKLISTLNSTGNTYDVQMEIQVLDENPGKKATVAESTKIGENVYYSKYTTQIWDELEKNDGIMNLKEGDRVVVSVKNTSSTISQQLKNFFYKVAGSDTYQVSASSTGIVAVNGV